MSSQVPWRPVLVGAATFVLVFAVALGCSRSLARVGGPGHVLSARAVADDVGVVLLAASLAVLAGIGYLLAGLLRRPRHGSDEPERVREEPRTRWWEKPLALGIGLLTTAGLVAAVLALVRSRHGAPRSGTATGVTPTPLGHAHPSSAPQAVASPVHWWLFAALALVLLMAAALALAWRRLGRREAPPFRRLETREVQRLLEESLADLEREADPRRAVIRAYGGMERALARHGLERRPYEAPLEYLARLPATLGVSRAASARLTAVFQRARFSEHAIDAEMKREAIGALATVRDELAEHSR